jgi:type I restriction enzyme S subunit
MNMDKKWEYKKMGDVCIVERGGSPRPINNYITDSDDGVNWIKIGDTDDSMFITHTEQKIKPEGMKKSRYVQPGDFLLSNSMSFGRPYILKIDGCIHDGWLVLRDKDDIFDKRFLYYYLGSPTTYRRFKQLAVGGVVNNLNSEMVRNVMVPVLPMGDQIEIAEQFNAVKEIITKRKEQFKLLDTLIKSQFVEMFGNPITNSMKWNCKEVTDICDKIYGGGTPSKSHSEYFEGNIPWVSPKDMKVDVIIDSIDHISEGAVKNSSAKMVPVNSVLMVIRSGILKHTLPVAINRVPVAVNQDMKVFIPSKHVTSQYLLFLFKIIEKDILSGVRSVTADNIDFNSFKKRSVPVPPIDLQNQFTTFVQKIDELKVEVKKSLNENQFLFDSLMQTYFE